MSKNPMSEKDEITLEEITDDKEEKKTEEMPPSPPPTEKSPEDPTPSDEKLVETVAKSAPRIEDILKKSGMTAHLDLIWSLLDRMIGLGGDSGPLAGQTKAILKWITGDVSSPIPALTPINASASFSKEETSQLIAQEVKKQLGSALKEVPVIRKGLVQAEEESNDIKKKFDGLPPEQKLKVALALNH